VSRVEGAHPPNVQRRKAANTGECALQIRRQALYHLLAITLPFLRLQDQSPDIPIECEQLPIGRQTSLYSGNLHPRLNLSQEWAVIGGQGNRFSHDSTSWRDSSRCGTWSNSLLDNFVNRASVSCTNPAA
jgi:hypothetical protein